MPDRVPFAGAGWKVTDGKRPPGLIGQLFSQLIFEDKKARFLGRPGSGPKIVTLPGKGFLRLKPALRHQAPRAPFLLRSHG
jgi:hypothetical protein